MLAGEVVDGATMSAAELDAFLKQQIQRAKDEDLLFSVHLKATMMKVQDPIVFGHAVRSFFPKVFDQFGDTLASAGINPADGVASMLKSAQNLPADERVAIERASVRASTTARAWRWSTTATASPTCIARHDHRRPRCRR